MSENMDHGEYDAYIENMRKTEYPMLKDQLYLDHAGTTLYSKSLMDRFHADMLSSLYGNPHSASSPSQKSSQEIEAVRMKALRYFNADPDHFDLVFTCNTTSAIKLVMEAFRDQEHAFLYGYHRDSHTSLVGVREAAKEHACLTTEDDIRQWLHSESKYFGGHRLFAYPAQSNMNGHRLPLDWPPKLRELGIYCLMDAAALAATSRLNLADTEAAPDFTVLSFSKIFGFPDLGALIVKKECAHLFQRRTYFGGGTVDMVVCLKEQWHIKKTASLHEQLEEGTLPIHSILALKSAMKTHQELFRSLEHVAAHTTYLAKQLYDGLSSLRHHNGHAACTIYLDEHADYERPSTQGPTVAFNLRDSKKRWISNTEIEKLASVRNIHLRTGGLCNPGGNAFHLDLSPWEMRENFSAGLRCGSENDIMNGKPTGVVRVSLGAMSTRSDVEKFVDFVDEFMVDKTPPQTTAPCSLALDDPTASRLYVESLSVYPIKSCGGFSVPYDTPWDVHREGLAWDREWCVVSQATGKALSQKSHPRMALVRPQLEFTEGLLRIKLAGSTAQISVPLSRDPSYFAAPDFKDLDASVCGDTIKARVYTSKTIADFFTRALGVPCTLARFPAATQASPSVRHSKTHLHQKTAEQNVPRPILLSNESPILTISRSSLNRLNESIKAKGGKAAYPAVFRANIVLAEDPLQPPGHEQPWAEDYWQGMRIGGENGPSFEFLGGCRRCQMVCVDQESAEKNQEPFSTLAKTRRVNGRVLFGVHTCLAGHEGGSVRISAGDKVGTWN
ncbi:molybdenum cofactor sulfurase [Lecanosticta acicola]|uniref:Molybdenum cofactor sulfurase n=1 Tax=Lecanosticta acicola TaxID=111012 RepID=A0AAI8YTG0_9PEZI|nr:molybdenum cofactor sulfurase [Lecanosticta acicola]